MATKKLILEVDSASRRRVYLVPFNVSFKERENKDLEEQLKAEAEGILQLMIAACQEWAAHRAIRTQERDRCYPRIVSGNWAL